MFPMFRRIRTRQWLPLAALGLGVVASAIGAAVGQPNSWIWFAVGVSAAVIVALAFRGSSARSGREPG